MSIKNLSIKSKLLLLQLLVVFSVLVLYSVFHFLNYARIYQETVVTRLVSMANMIGYNSASALNFRDTQDAAKTLKFLDAETHITHAWILDTSGRIVATYWKPGRNSDKLLIKEGEYEETKGRTLTLSRRIFQDGEIIGSIFLRYELDSYPTMLLRDAPVVGLTLLGGMGIALLFALFTHRVLSAPIHRIVETIGRVVQTKDLSIRIGEQRKDEIGILYQGFNNMLDEIHNREKERDQAAAALRESEEKYRTLVEKAEDGIVIIQDQRFVYVNPSLAAMSESSPEELIGTLLIQHIDESEVSKLRRYYDNRMNGLASASMYETIFKTKSGQRLYAEVNAALIPYQGKPADLVIIRNINERKKAEAAIRELNETLERRVAERTWELAAANERLIELDQMKSLFLASMSHELRTPLNSIIGFTDLLLMGMSGDLNEEQAKQLTMVKNSSAHLLDLINGILDISKIESGKVELMIESFPIAEVTNETLKAVTPLAKAKGLELAADVPESLILQSDRRRVKQVLMNLLSNAIKFSDQGSIRVEVGTRGEELAVSVSDCGIGIRCEDVEKLFSPFRQIDMSSTKRYEGTGLGLYLCKKILARLGGTISVKSEYGHGSTFTFILPMKQKGNADEENTSH
jgi:PAS domain S-box-containing protein